MFHPLVNPAPSRGILLICLFLMMSTHKRAEFRKRREAVQGSGAPTCKEVMELRYAPARPLRRRIASTPRTMRRRGSGAAIGGGKFDAPAVLWSFLTEEKGHCAISSFSLPRKKQTGAVPRDTATKPPGQISYLSAAAVRDGNLPPIDLSAKLFASPLDRLVKLI